MGRNKGGKAREGEQDDQGDGHCTDGKEGEAEPERQSEGGKQERQCNKGK